VGTVDIPNLISWADTERDLSAWLGNAMQHNAINELYRLEGTVKATNDADILNQWRRLQTSDHFYYMCTKYFADGDVHKYFNPYDTPYDSYINFMNVLDNLKSRCLAAGAPEPPRKPAVPLPQSKASAGTRIVDVVRKASTSKTRRRRSAEGSEHTSP
jgi:alpha-amylase